MVADGYCTLVTHKLEVAKYHLREFERLVKEETASFGGDYPEMKYAPFHGHADGAVFEAFAAFDTFSCAVAHKFGVPRSDHASFKTIGHESKVPPEIRERVAGTIATEEWTRLKWLRNVAGHRGVVSESFRWGSHLPQGFRVNLPDGEEALPVMEKLLRWSDERIRDLFIEVCDRERSILQFRGSEATIEVERKEPG
jgi:hypothetical protein